MARRFHLAFLLDDVEQPVTAANISLRPAGASEARVTLDPSDAVTLSLDPSDRWSVRLMHTDENGIEGASSIMEEARASAAQYENAFRPPVGSSLGEYLASRQITIEDRYAAYRDYGPGEDIERLNTDTRRELGYIAQQMGMAGAILAAQPTQIDRIVYTRDSGWFDPLAAYFAAFGLLDIVEPSTGRLFLYDTRKLHSAMPRANRKLTLADYNPASVRVDVRPLVTQAKVVWTDFAGEGPQAGEPARIRTESDLADDGSGHLNRTYVKWAELGENPADPSETTREYVLAQGTAQTIDGEAVTEEETTITYEGDYARIKETTSVTSSRVDLPYVGPTYGVTDTTVETSEYDPHPLTPGLWILRKKTRIRTGVVVFIRALSEADPDGSITKRETATPAVEASHARTVDTSGDSTQGWEDGVQISTWIERYQRVSGSNMVAVSGSETDDIRRRPIRPPWSRTELGDTVVDERGKSKFEYVGTAGRKAVTIDATKIGKALGFRIANRLISRTNPPTTIRLTLTRPDYVRYRLGWVVELDDDAPWNLTGKYLCTGVDFEARAPEAQRPNVVQTLELLRLW